MSRRFIRLVVSVAAAWVMFAAGAVSAAPSRRFALLIGNNEGGNDTVGLRYAEADANKLSAVLGELGGFEPADVAIVLGGTADEVLSALDGLENRVRVAAKAESHTTLLVYYSGHAKQGNLRLGQSRLPMAALRERLATSRADIRIGILDACESGAITREKGGRRGPSFLFEADDREPARGLILISSSSENESSQESDELAGSFFTHYLASGLRGDADETQDQRITLGEVYQYTYHKTVSVTAGTRSGTQHPTYSYDLEGQGDIVLTDLTNGASGVLFGAQLVGDYLIFDLGHDRVSAEINKRPGEARRLALPPGEYAVKKRLTDHLRLARFRLGPGDDYRVDDNAMERVSFEDDYAKGEALRLAETQARARATVKATFVYQSFFSSDVRDSLFPATTLFGLTTDFAPVLGASLSFDILFGGRSNQTLGLEGLALPYNFFELEMGVGLVWKKSIGPIDLLGGPRLVGLYMLRSFPKDEDLASRKQDHFGFSPGILVGVAFAPGTQRDLSIELLGRAGYMAFGVDQNRSLIFGELGLSVGYRL